MTTHILGSWRSWWPPRAGTTDRKSPSHAITRLNTLGSGGWTHRQNVDGGGRTTAATGTVAPPDTAATVQPERPFPKGSTSRREGLVASHREDTLEHASCGVGNGILVETSREDGLWRDNSGSGLSDVVDWPGTKDSNIVHNTTTYVWVPGGRGGRTRRPPGRPRDWRSTCKYSWRINNDDSLPWKVWHCRWWRRIRGIWLGHWVTFRFTRNGNHTLGTPGSGICCRQCRQRTVRHSHLPWW